MAGHRALKDFPTLSEWYAQAKKASRNDCDLTTWLAIKTCAVIDADMDSYILKSWIGTLRKSFLTSQDLRSDILSIISCFHDHKADFAELLGDLSYRSIELGLGDTLLPILQHGAEKSRIAALGFLAAWTALNCNRPDVCIEECDKVDEPYAPLHAIQGQAFLEIGKPIEALESLEVATTLAPEDIVSWFQKAKALQVMDRSLEAFDALKICERLAPDSNEVALFMAIIATGIDQELEIKHHAWTTLRPHLKSWGHVSYVPFTLLRLAFDLGDKLKAQDLILNLDAQVQLKSPKELEDLADLLRCLQRQGWMDIAAGLLQKTVHAESP